MAASRPSLVASALRLSYFTIGWNGVIGTSALVVSTLTGSLALIGFALNALLDSSASLVLVWRFRGERANPHAAERLEHRAQLAIVAAVAFVAFYVGFESVRALAHASHPDQSVTGIPLAAVSLLVLPWLALRKLEVAAALPSAALRGDGLLTISTAALAAVTLLALVATSAFGWWWADPGAALLIAVGLAIEAARVAVRHRFG